MGESVDDEGTAARGRSNRRWIVDGMNVIGSRPDGWWNDPDRALRRLIEQLDRYEQDRHEELTVVFDRRPPDVSAGRHGSITVGFASRRGRNAADHEIVEIVAHDPDPRSITVVTSDARLGERVRDLGAAVMTSGTFRRRLDEATR
jgi:predicted RNA-binding protein with PIN domain